MQILLDDMAYAMSSMLFIFDVYNNVYLNGDYINYLTKKCTLYLAKLR